MTVETGVVPGRQNYRVRSHAERERAFQGAARHSRQVDMLRKALPVLAVVVFAGYFISSRLSMTVGGITASIDGVKVENGNLRMVNPKLKGMDKKNGTYVIGAEYADQDVKTLRRSCSCMPSRPSSTTRRAAGPGSRPCAEPTTAKRSG